MKVSKRVSALLFLAVVVVWGLVIRKVITALSDPGPVFPATSRETVAVPEKKAELLLNYRDPFLGRTFSPPPSPPADPGKKGRNIPAVQPDTPPAFRYKGIIGKQRKEWLLIEAGRETRMIDWKKEKQIEGYGIEQVYPDSLVLSREKKRYVIRLQ
ncbi:MAG: hypothetical protein LBR65_02075 [Culturomica sp.]|jgi:hypothetical protein|nr:hypothetical protein [Culturomica sp.]